MSWIAYSKENNGNQLAYWERHLVTYNKSDYLVIRPSSMLRLNLNVLYGKKLFNIKSNINKVTCYSYKSVNFKICDDMKRGSVRALYFALLMLRIARFCNIIHVEDFNAVNMHFPMLTSHIKIADVLMKNKAFSSTMARYLYMFHLIYSK